VFNVLAHSRLEEPIHPTCSNCLRPAGPDDRWWLPAHLGGTAPTPEVAAADDAVRAAGKAPKPVRPTPAARLKALVSRRR